MKKTYFGSWFTPGVTAPSLTVAPVAVEPMPDKPKGGRIPVFNREVAAGCQAMRSELVTAGYSSYVSDAIVEDIVCKVLRAAADVR